MTEFKRFWGIAAGCVLAVGQQASAADTVDAVFASDSAWVNPVQLAHAESTAGDALNIQQVSCFGSDGCFLSSEPGELWDFSDTMFSALGNDEPCWDIGGWFSAGYSNRADGTVLRVPNHLNLQQGWLYADKLADGSEGLDWGFRADVMYGTDGYFAQSYGNNRGRWDFQDAFDHGDYAWAIPQLFATIAYHDLTIKVGHFFTLHGYEAVPSLGRPFYSGAFSWFYSEPFEHTGVMTSYKVSDDLTVHACWVLGWDTGFDNFDGGNAFQPGFTAKIVGDTTLSWFCTVGNNGWIGDGYTQSAVLTVPFAEKFTYIAVSDLIHGNAAPFGGRDYDTISFYNYLLYQMTDRTRLGGRAEWLKANGVSYYEVTAGVTFVAHSNFTVRPEIRYQWSPAAEGTPANNPLAIPSLGDAIFGVDATLTF